MDEEAKSNSGGDRGAEPRAAGADTGHDPGGGEGLREGAPSEGGELGAALGGGGAVDREPTPLCGRGRGAASSGGARCGISAIRAASAVQACLGQQWLRQTLLLG
jgi:hypothetical protein